MWHGVPDGGGGVVARVYVHVGLPKTGTSYLQRTLERSRERLATTGVLVPGGSERSQRDAVYDLLGRRVGGADASRVVGSWPALVEEVRGWPGGTALLSEELLVHATPAQCRRVVRDLAPAEVHVVVTVRDLGRAMSSMWQQNIQKGRTWTWPEFVAAVRDPDRGPATAGVAFWLRYDLRRVLADWSEVVPAEHVHVVVVPPAGAPATALLERYAMAVGLDRADFRPPGQQVNTSLGVVETELLRRLNLGLDGRLDEQRHRHVIGVLKPGLRREGAPGTVLPEQDRPWAERVAQALVADLAAGGHHVVGDLADLTGTPPLPGGATDAVPDAALADTAVRALVLLAERGVEPRQPVDAGPAAAPRGVATRLTSAARATSFRARVGLLQAADASPAVARLAGLYLRRRSRGVGR